MDNDIKMLIDTFKEYRDLITPIEQSLRSFSLSFDGISEDLKSLKNGLDGDVQSKLDKIYKELSSSSEKTKLLSQDVDRFLSSTGKYVSSVDKIVTMCESIEKKLSLLNSIEERANNQIDKLNTIIEDKKKTYDIKGLERKLEQYNVGVEKVSEYINTDVVETLKNNSDTISQIRDKNNSIFEAISEERGSIDKLVESYHNSSKLLKKVVESNDVNEEYIYEILDKWAESRKVKTKK